MFAVIDVETTGGHLYDDRITEIAVFVTDGKRIIKSFDSLVNPQRKITPFVVKLTGITDEMVTDAPIFEEIANEILSITEDCIFVAHNIGFDYSMVKREFKRIGISYRRPNLCTVQLSQRVFKDQPSYSLGNLTENLGIKLTDRHRAFGDAEATALLLHKIIEKEGMENVVHFSNNNAQNIDFKGVLTQENIDELPEDPGLFRLMDKNNKVLYLKSAKNIYAEVTKFLSKDIKLQKYEGLFEQIHSIDTQVYNSVIIAELQEVEELRTTQPKFNRASRFKKHPVGVFENKGHNGPAFYVERSASNKALWRFHTEKKAYSFLRKFIKENKLQTPVNNPTDEELHKFKSKVELALQKHVFPQRNFMIIRDVSFANVMYAIHIEDYTYQGFAQIDKEFYDGRMETLKEQVILYENNPFVLKLLQRYLNKKKTVKLLPC